MAIRDYIVCKRCEYKILYDEHYHGREMMQALWGDPSAVFWTPLLLCPACIALLESELAACLEAVGMLTTLAPSMEINVLDPVGMAHQIVATVNAELAELQAMYEQQGFTIKRQQDELARREEQLSGAMDKINLYERYAMRAIRDLEPYQQANPKLQSLWQRAKNLSTDAARKGEGE